MKKILTTLFLFFFVYVSCEFFSFFAHYLVFSKSLSLNEVSKIQKSIITEDIDQVTNVNYMVPHPYFGTAYNDDYKVKYAGLNINEFGLIDNKAPLPKKSKDKIVVGVFGGSVAWWLSANQYFEKALELKFGNKNVEVIRVALGAWKQPQQAQALSLLLQLGAEFDIVINVDGYNEIALPFYNQTNNYFYPHYWSRLSTNLYNSNTLGLVGKINLTKKVKFKLASLFNSFRYSYSASFIWKLVNRITESRISSYQESFSKLTNNSEHRASIHGPKINVKYENFYQFLAKFWFNGSLLMHDLCNARNIKYFNFLQPNQYFKNSKIFSKKEREEYIVPQGGGGVENGYPILKKLGKDLKQKGVNFFDATMVFKNVKETTYSDNCCHLNDRGERELSDFIVESLNNSLTLE